MQDIRRVKFEMKKYIGKIARFVGFFTGLFVLLVISSSFFMPESAVYNAVLIDQKTVELKNEKPDSIDVIFAGDSECYATFSPVHMWRDYGFTSFLCATSAQRLCDTYNILQSTFETQSPKLVVVNTNTFYRSAELEKASDDKYVKFLGKLLPVFRYHSRWKTFMSREILNEDEEENYNEDQLLKGFRIRTAIKGYKGDAYMIETDEKEKIAPLALDYMQKIKTLCEENDCELILVSAPSAKNWNYERHNAVSEWAGENNISYIDLNLKLEEMEIDWTVDTKDGGDHLNYDGAKKVTSYFGKYLTDNYELPDHRNDEKFDYWNDYVDVIK